VRFFRAKVDVYVPGSNAMKPTNVIALLKYRVPVLRASPWGSRLFEEIQGSLHWGKIEQLGVD